MAIIKHIPSHNADYNKILAYYTHIHREHSGPNGHYEIILDANGLPRERENCRTIYINASGHDAPLENWTSDCNRTNRRYHKNTAYDDIKSHHFIISFPTEDRDKLTWEQLETIARRFTLQYCAGHQALISIHRDTDHDHIHVTINSVRACGRPPAEWMVHSDDTGQLLLCETKAGGKYQDSHSLMRARNDWLLRVCQEYGLKQEDNNKAADAHKIARNSEKNEFLRKACLSCAYVAKDIRDFKNLLQSQYGVALIIRGKTISVQHPDSKKAVRLKTLSLEPKDLFEKMGQSAAAFCQEIEEKKQFIDWINLRRQQNDSRAVNVVRESEAILCLRMKAAGEHYVRDEFHDLNTLILQSVRLEDSLQIEIEKMDRLINRWLLYFDTSLSLQERQKHRGYVRWCGCQPDDTSALSDLQSSQRAAVLQQKMAIEMRSVLLATASRWRMHNDLERALSKQKWVQIREDQLKHQLRYTKSNLNRLADICNACEKVAIRHTHYSTALVEQAHEKFDTWPPGWETYGKYHEEYIRALSKKAQLHHQGNTFKNRQHSTTRHTLNGNI